MCFGLQITNPSQAQKRYRKSRGRSNRSFWRKRRSSKARVGGAGRMMYGLSRRLGSMPGREEGIGGGFRERTNHTRSGIFVRKSSTWFCSSTIVKNKRPVPWTACIWQNCCWGLLQEQEEGAVNQQALSSSCSIRSEQWGGIDSMGGGRRGSVPPPAV